MNKLLFIFLFICLPIYINCQKNVSFWGDKKDVKAKMNEVRMLQKAYIKKYKDIANNETRKYHIPASIIFSQGILETNCGQSFLATRNNNHFNIKCFSKACDKSHCSNVGSHKDFYRVYNTAWQSFREHSLILMSYKIKAGDEYDYKFWAKELQRKGYSSDHNYSKNLIKLIEDLGMDSYSF